MKILHTADWHIGVFKGPEKDGVNLRSLDTKKCLEFMVEKAREELPELVLVSGDIFHTGRTWSDRCCDEVITAKEIISKLSAVAKHIVVMRGTPNHDGEGQFQVLKEFFSEIRNIHVVTEPQVIQTEYADIAVVPGFDHGFFRAKFPGLGKEEENETFSNELGNIVMGLKAQCRPDRVAVLMAHYTVPGCNTESGQSQLLTQFEPIIPVESLEAADYDLVALGHIHRPQELESVDNAFYSGSINANNFNDEGQERGFWIHSFESPFEGGKEVRLSSEFVKTPYREFLTYHFTDTDITAILQGHIDEVAMNFWRWNGAAADKIVRVLYECSAEKHKALNTNVVANALYEDGAFWVTGVTPERVEAVADRRNMSKESDPEGNLVEYLTDKGYSPEDIERLVLKARPIIAEALASDTSCAFSGMFVPIEIEVKNYRTYAEEKFNFEDIQFCTINGQNGAGKSSLFMDAIIDCLFEEPREGSLKDDNKRPMWLRNDESASSGYISFTFGIGDAVYRVVRTRTKSGKGSLNLSELVNGEWQDRSQEKFNDTQADIERIVGVDSLTFRSCALIMQDQYGLFLQAKKEDRMVILGNLLGLGIYGAMEDIAKDLAADRNRVINGKRKNIEVQSGNILAYGNPAEELDEKKISLKAAEEQLKQKNLELNNKAIVLSTMKGAQTRYQKLLEGISILEGKKRATGQNREAEEIIVAGCDSALAMESEISEKVGRYWELDSLTGTLITGATLYNQTAEIEITDKEIASLGADISLDRSRLSVLQKDIEKLENRTDAEAIKENAALYEEKKKKLEDMYQQRQTHAELMDKRNRIAYAFESKKAYFNEQERALLKEEASLRKRTELLENSGCTNIENAGCRFLADAIQAKEVLVGIPKQKVNLQIDRDKSLSALEKELVNADAEVQAMNFRSEELDALRNECERLQKYESMLRELQEDESRIAVIRAQIDTTLSNISKAEERLDTLKLKAQRLAEEREKYKEDYLKFQRVTAEMAELKPWIEKEKDLPVVKERRSNAAKRIEELGKTILELESEIAEKQEQAEAELIQTVGIEEVEAQRNILADEAELLTVHAKELQKSIGGLEQKISEIRRMQAAISEIQNEINELSEDAADYEQLKLSFSQDGIPHQIIRTIIPKLSATANSILSQMTGGQLGIDFRTEKVLKSNSKKEIVTLDIFIEEYGKSSLPYLSKSGGEKVKSSLSVILALAEIKSSTAGIQFGMLFIDEPPFLDGDGIQAYCDALETIGVRYPGIKIMAITHDPTMKARFPQNLDVVKTDNGSKVIY